ncbi:MAG TPA: thiamine phosphate synthase [Terriglobia bacterium]|nr:thiamine phosphate synthase [Terriglobia bacterium]
MKLCYITDRHALEPLPLLSRVLEAIGAGIDLVQVREKDLATRPLLALVQAAVEAARDRRTQVIVNDRLDVALAGGAAGVHLGTQSMPARAVREHVPPGFLVGVSCHSLQDALAAEADGADYVVLGPVFETLSKLRYGPPLGLEELREAAAQVKIPVLALGGVTVGRVPECLSAGASGIAGISIFQNCESVAERVQELKRRMNYEL